MKNKKIGVIIGVIALIIIVIVVAKMGSSGSLDNNNYNEYSSNSSNPVQEVKNNLDHISKVPEGYIGVYTAEDLQNVQNNLNACYIMMNDINLNGIEFHPIDGFEGSFDGNNYIIKNYYSNNGIFSSIKDASIENLHFQNATIEREGVQTSKYVGGIVGWVSFIGEATSYIGNCSFQGKIISTEDAYVIGYDEDKDSLDYVGGILGNAEEDVIVSNCCFSGSINVNETKYLGGIIGRVESVECNIDNSYSVGKININNVYDLGGIAGSCDYIYNCYSGINITVNNDFDRVGGITAYSRINRLNNVYYLGEIAVNDNEHVGAIAGDVQDRSSLDEPNSEKMYCYYSSNLNAFGNDKMYDNVIVLTSEQMKTKKSFNGFDFDEVWKMGNNDYPYPLLKSSAFNYSK